MEWSYKKHVFHDTMNNLITIPKCFFEGTSCNESKIQKEVFIKHKHSKIFVKYYSKSNQNCCVKHGDICDKGFGVHHFNICSNKRNKNNKMNNISYRNNNKNNKINNNSYRNNIHNKKKSNKRKHDKSNDYNCNYCNDDTCTNIKNNFVIDEGKEAFIEIDNVKKSDVGTSSDTDSFVIKFSKNTNIFDLLNYVWCLIVDGAQLDRVNDDTFDGLSFEINCDGDDSTTTTTTNNNNNNNNNHNHHHNNNHNYDCKVTDNDEDDEDDDVEDYDDDDDGDENDNQDDDDDDEVDSVDNENKSQLCDEISDKVVTVIRDDCINICSDCYVYCIDSSDCIVSSTSCSSSSSSSSSSSGVCRCDVNNESSSTSTSSDDFDNGNENDYCVLLL
ncbi:uncharacterized protein LOC142324261 isoform X1 [Lycorma delicatula]|uniref:uncharacterized protein LOC142324261 isoform X1 n=1 Tax=Lycorma delicatula TaxID=130591 RepID=UPI003F50F113